MNDLPLVFRNTLSGHDPHFCWVVGIGKDDYEGISYTILDAQIYIHVITQGITSQSNDYHQILQKCINLQFWQVFYSKID